MERFGRQAKSIPPICWGAPILTQTHVVFEKCNPCGDGFKREAQGSPIIAGGYQCEIETGPTAFSSQNLQAKVELDPRAARAPHLITTAPPVEYEAQQKGGRRRWGKIRISGMLHVLWVCWRILCCVARTVFDSEPCRRRACNLLKKAICNFRNWPAQCIPDQFPGLLQAVL